MRSGRRPRLEGSAQSRLLPTLADAILDRIVHNAHLPSSRATRCARGSSRRSSPPDRPHQPRPLICGRSAARTGGASPSRWQTTSASRRPPPRPISSGIDGWLQSESGGRHQSECPAEFRGIRIQGSHRYSTNRVNRSMNGARAASFAPRVQPIFGASVRGWWQPMRLRRGVGSGSGEAGVGTGLPPSADSVRSLCIWRACEGAPAARDSLRSCKRRLPPAGPVTFRFRS